MNKKGFTLVELLAVIVILAVLALVANSSVTNVIKNSKSDQYNAQIELIKATAQTWGDNNLNRLPNDGECSYITLGDLKIYGLLENDVINPKTNKKFSDDLAIKITSKLNNNEELVSSYEVNPSNIKNCNYAYPAVCTLLLDSDSSNTVTKGDKYSCEVREGIFHTFYVLSINDDNLINLIMERNICSDGSYATSENTCLMIDDYDNNYRPVTLIEYLNNATSDWDNIQNLNISYDDEGENFTDFKITGKARMPYLSEVSIFDETNAYLYDYLEDSGIQNNSLSGIDGYFTLSSIDTTHPGSRYKVHYSGVVNYDTSVLDIDSGIRPVITLPNKLLENKVIE